MPMRIDALSYSNVRNQGVQRRAALLQQSPEHITQCNKLMLNALQHRSPSTSRSVLILGAGACTEVPLVALARAADEVVLADLDLAAMQQGRDELASPALRKRVRLVQSDLGSGVSGQLAHLIEQQPWKTLIPQGAQAVFDAATHCLEQCLIPDPPELPGLGTGEFGVVISSLILTQLYSYPLLDILDKIQQLAPQLLGEQDRHRRYHEAAQTFRVGIIQAHLHLLSELLDTGGVIVLLSDMHGFVFDVHGTDHDVDHRRTIPLVPRTFPDLVRKSFTLIEEAHWEWLTDLPEKGKPGRGYEVVGYVLR